jgi:hypothetical protein
MANGQNNGRQPPRDRDAPSQGNQPQRPVHEVRLGRVKAAVWLSIGQYGVRHTVKVSKVYKAGDGGGERWQSTDVFFVDDLLVLAKVIDLAHTWIHQQGSTEDIPF